MVTVSVLFTPPQSGLQTVSLETGAGVDDLKVG